jgi:hypothetical protein
MKNTLGCPLPALFFDPFRFGTNHDHGVGRQRVAESIPPLAPPFFQVACGGASPSDVDGDLLQLAAERLWKTVDRADEVANGVSQGSRGHSLFDHLLEA